MEVLTVVREVESGAAAANLTVAVVVMTTAPTVISIVAEVVLAPAPAHLMMTVTTALDAVTVMMIAALAVAVTNAVPPLTVARANLLNLTRMSVIVELFSCSSSPLVSELKI
jgi:hypothetical protein